LNLLRNQFIVINVPERYRIYVYSVLGLNILQNKNFRFRIFFWIWKYWAILFLEHPSFVGDSWVTKNWALVFLHPSADLVRHWIDLFIIFSTAVNYSCYGYYAGFLNICLCLFVLSVCLSSVCVCLSVCRFVYLSVCLSVCLFSSNSLKHDCLIIYM